MESCLWEEKCFPIFSSQSIIYIYIIPTSPDGKSRQNLSGQFFALKNSWWIWAWDSSNSCYQYPRWRAVLFFSSHKSLDCGFLDRKVDEAILFQIFFESEDQFWHPCGFNYKLMVTFPLSSSNGEKTTHRKALKLFITMLNTFWRISTPTKTITQPHTGFWVDLQLPGAAAKKHLELKSAKAEEIRSWERKWREAGPDVLKLGTHGWAGKRFQDVFFWRDLLKVKKAGWMGVMGFCSIKFP